MNIKITIDAPELAGAIEALAVALSGKGLPATILTPTREGTPITDGGGFISQEEVDINTAEIIKKKQDADVAEAEKERLAALQKADAEKAAALKAKQEADAAAKAAALKAKQEADAAAKAADAPETSGPSFQDVKDKLMGFSRAGKQVELKELITSFGAAKLSDIKEEDYADLIAKADALL